MSKRKIFSHIFPSFILVIILVLLVSVWHTGKVLKTFYIDQLSKELETGAQICGVKIAEMLKSKDYQQLRLYCAEFKRLSMKRITVLEISGNVLSDSDEDPLKMDNHADREEIKKAIGGSCGKSIRYSPTLKKRMLYVAVPISDEGKIIGVTRFAVPVNSIDMTLESIYMRLIFFGAVVAFVSIAISIFISRKISRPIESLKIVASNYAKGNFSVPPPVSGIEEIDDLSLSLDGMAQELNLRLLEIMRERNRQQAILTSMHEGVIAVDSGDLIILMNRAALKLLKISSHPEGRLFQEIVRSPDIQGFILQIKSSGMPVEKEINIYGSESVSINLRGTILAEAGGKTMGALIVLNDITKLKNLEKIRREFVANVSHELKTPLTAIKASVETIMDGDIKKEKDLEKLLKIIRKHTDRLSVLLEDTLSLSELESKENNCNYKFEEVPVKQLIDSALSYCGENADFRKIELKTKCEKDFRMKVNVSLMEQALMNLIDNAIKYSEEKSHIEIQVSGNGNFINIAVIDFGCGIPPEDLPRIFERFYRVDKARSRKLGGSGLGLAIVKHIMNVHNGKVEVESEPGKGSRFTISIPVSHSCSDGIY